MTALVGQRLRLFPGSLCVKSHKLQAVRAPSVVPLWSVSRICGLVVVVGRFHDPCLPGVSDGL